MKFYKLLGELKDNERITFSPTPVHGNIEAVITTSKDGKRIALSSVISKRELDFNDPGFFEHFTQNLFEDLQILREQTK